MHYQNVRMNTMWSVLQLRSFFRCQSSTCLIISKEALLPFSSKSSSFCWTTSCGTHNNNNIRISSISFSSSSSSSLSSPNGFENEKAYRTVSGMVNDMVKKNKLHYDHTQERAARRLTRLQEVLVDYRNEPFIDIVEMMEKRAKEKQKEEEKEEEDPQESRRSDKDKSTLKNNNEQNTTKIKSKRSTDNNSSISKNKKEEQVQMMTPRGLFLYGDVGTGKTMLMDVFYQEVPISYQSRKKRRVHFHSFMQDIHKRVHELKQSDLSINGRNFTIDTSIYNNPIYRVGKQIASETSVLCFDEFQITDIADAYMIKQLFETLWRCGVVVVATSNRSPHDLYENGINRSYFLPFIDLLCKQCILHEMKSKIDYRLLLSSSSTEAGIVPLNEFFLVDPTGQFNETSDLCNETYKQLLRKNNSNNNHDDASNDNNTLARTIEIDVGFNRKFTIEDGDPSGFVGKFSFNELCNANLGSSDYRAIAQYFDIIILENIPKLSTSTKHHNQARRFITLIDELYEGKCTLLCSAVSKPEHLFVDDDDNNNNSNDNTVDGSSIETKVGEMFGIDVAQQSMNNKTIGELASVRELKFAFRRASSRLNEMCSKQWWEKIL